MFCPIVQSIERIFNNYTDFRGSKNEFNNDEYWLPKSWCKCTSFFITSLFLRLINMVCQKHAKNESYALMKV